VCIIIYNEILEKINECINNTINYTDRAKRDLKSVHFTEDILKDILLNPTKIDEYRENNYIVHGKNTAKIRIEFANDNSLLIHWIEYNKVPFIV
jgi:GTPase SAR1 family protein